MDFKVLPCAQMRCTAQVVAGRGYCLYHGGPMRLDREFRAQEAEARAILRKGATPKPHTRRVDWGPAGAPVGSGLSKWAKYDDAKKPAPVEPPAETAPIEVVQSQPSV